MQVGIVVFANKWTGAGAVAELNCRALHSAGIDAQLLFVGGRNLERRLDGHSWAMPGLVKERAPSHLRSNLRAIASQADACDIVICHLPHDHLLCVAAGVHRRIPLVRAFRNPRHIRRDPFHDFINRRLAGAVCAYSALEEDLNGAVPGLPKTTITVPLEERFKPTDGSAWRSRLGIPSGAPVIGAVGKLARGRGFNLLLDIASLIEEPAHVVVVGHGELQPELEKQARNAGLVGRVHWTGYQDGALPELYSAMDVVFFTAPGSDWGHRAISEAQGCGRPVVAVAYPGVENLIEAGVTALIVDSDPVALADAAHALIKDSERSRRLGDAAAKAAAERRFGPVGERIARFIETIPAR